MYDKPDCLQGCLVF